VKRIELLIWAHVFFLLARSIDNAARGELGWYLFDWAFIHTGVIVLAVAQMAQEMEAARGKGKR
jgi:hypothetical protein